MGTLSKNQIEPILRNNTYNIFFKKITGLTESIQSDLEEGKRLISESEMKNYTIFMALKYPMNNSSKIIPLSVEINKVDKDDDNNKKFDVIITVKKWDEFKYSLTAVLKDAQTNANEFLKKSEAELKTEMKDQYKNATYEVIGKRVRNQIQQNKTIQNLNLDSTKAMYDLIKGESKTISVDLNSTK